MPVVESAGAFLLEPKKSAERKSAHRCIVGTSLSALTLVTVEERDGDSWTDRQCPKELTESESCPGSLKNMMSTSMNALKQRREDARSKAPRVQRLSLQAS